MKKLTAITMIALSLGLFEACKSGKGGGTSDSTTTTTDSTKITTDTLKKDSSAMMVMSDTAFAKKAAIGGMAEVALGKLALKTTSNTSIKDFAKMMVRDHGKADDELMGIAKKEHLTLPATVDSEHKMKMDSLSKLSGAAFDKAYVTAMIGGHKKTLTLMQYEAKNGKDTALKAFALKTEPVVQMHLDSITKIQSNMK